MVKSSIYKVILFSLFSNTAFAGAWLQPEGKFELIAEFEYNLLSSDYTNPNTNITSVAKTFGFQFYDLFIQYGVNKDITLGSKFRWFDYQGFAEYYPEEYDNFNYAKQVAYADNKNYQMKENKLLEANFFLQTEIWSDNNSILSIQPNLLIYPNDADTRYAGIAMKLLYGKNFSFINKDLYINTELGFNRILDELSNDNKRFNLDLTLGVRANKKCTAILQTFNSFNLGFREYTSIGQFSLLYHYNDKISWQTGYSTNLYKRNKYITESYITGIWIKF